MRTGAGLLEIQLQALQILIVLEGWDGKDPDWVSRQPDGRFGSGKQGLNKTDEINAKALTQALDRIVADSQEIDRVKDKVYRAFDIKNPQILEASFMTGFAAPDIVQKLVFEGLKQTVGLSSDQIRSIVKDLSENPAQKAEVAVAKYAEIKKQPQVYLGNLILAKYLDHKKELNLCLNAGIKLTEESYATQLGCLNAFAMETVVKAAPYLAIAILPELAGAASAGGTLEAMIARIVQEIPKRVPIEIAIERENQRFKEEQGAQQVISVAAGLVVGGALKEARDLTVKNPEALASVTNTVSEIANTIQEIDSFAEAIKKIDVKNIDREIQDLPQKHQKTWKTLTSTRE